MDEKRALLSGAVFCSVCGSTLTVEEDKYGKITVAPCEYCYKDLKRFIYRVTLHLQESRRKTPEQNDRMFQDAYRLYAKYDVEAKTALKGEP